jgi:2-polyprenyl-3-methyl-5-hydroxy-6-metoxy-1,4-benzoquinol methylase
MEQWYEVLFKQYKDYDSESYTKGTIGEVDFFEQEVSFNKSTKILDVGCGTGRHSLELARRGYDVLGFDLSNEQLQQAREKASNAGVLVDFLQCDARDFNFQGKYNLAIMICEGAFPLMESDEMNFKILQNVFASLSSKGKFIFTTLNGLFPLYHSVKDFVNSNSNGNESVNNTFDLMTFRDHSVFEFINDEGEKISLQCNERYYVPSEINWLLKSIGFVNISIHGCKLGAFSRKDILTTEDFEMLVIAEKE